MIDYETYHPPGTHEIGGTCIELIWKTPAFLLMQGCRLPKNRKNSGNPETFAKTNDSTSQGHLISHPHLDHYGLLAQIDHDVPVFAGKAASVLMKTTFELTDSEHEWIEPVIFRSGKNLR